MLRWQTMQMPAKSHPKRDLLCALQHVWKNETVSQEAQLPHPHQSWQVDETMCQWEDIVRGVFGYVFETLVPNLIASVLRTLCFVMSLKNQTVSFAGECFLFCFHSCSPSPELFLCPRYTKGEMLKGLNSKKCLKMSRRLCLISEEAKVTWEVDKEWMVLTRKTFLIVVCRADFRGATLCIMAKDRVEC